MSRASKDRRARKRQAERDEQYDNAKAPMTSDVNKNGGKGAKPVCKYNEKEPKRFFRRSGFWVVVFSCLQVVTTGIYTWFTYGLWITTDASVKEATASNKLVAESNRISREGNEASNRAWIVHSNEMTMNCPTAGVAPSVEYHLINSGNRPAIEVRKHASMVIVNRGPPETVRFPDSPQYPAIGKRLQSVAVVGPGRPLYDAIHSDNVLSEAIVANLKNQTWTQFVYGKVEYEDGYGRKRLTTWCYFWQPEPGGDCGKYSFNLCHTYNHAE